MVREYAFINAFRALAAFWVLVAHVLIWGYGINPIPGPKLAVDLFMVISGFLMAANATTREHFEPMAEIRSWYRFWLRRFFRIAPAYYVALLIAFAFSGYFVEGYKALQNRPVDVDFSATSFLMHASFFFGLHPAYASSTALPDWSLSLEMQFYFVFPALFVYLRSRERALFVGIAAALIGWILFLGARTGLFPKFPDPSFLLFKLQYFVAGMLLFRGRVHAAAFLVCLEAPIYGPQFIVLPILIYAMHCTRSADIRHRLIRFASDTSYGVYLFHGFAISAFGLITPNLIALAIPAAYLLGWIVFRFVETPGIALGKRAIAMRAYTL